MSPSSNDAHTSPPPDSTHSPPREPDNTRQLDKRDLPPPQSQPRPPPRAVNLRSSFDLEPNPFEQSFSNTRSSSGDSTDRKSDDSKPQNSDEHPSKQKPDSGTPKPVLPSLAALSSPSDGYSWSDLAGSLRSGPLSPAMLQGPQQPQQQQSSNIPLSSYDPTRSFGRTGLTPSTGLTPLVGGPVSFPPPSPNTAAFLAMVTNSTSASQIGSTPATITPNTLSAITGMLNPSQPQQQSTAIAPSATTSSSNTNGITTAAPHQQQQQQQHALSVSHIPTQSYQYSQVPQHNGQQTNGYAPTSASNAANAAANGLFLLSQAHQELTKREEAQARAGQADANMNKRGSKRKSTDAPLPAPSSRAPPNKRPRANTRGGRRAKASPGSPDEDEDSVDEEEMRAAVEESERGAQTNGNKKPETEEEKRRNFLERNRQAALKCRQRKKAWLAQLQAKVEFLTNENDRLTTALVSSREEISRLNALLGAAPQQPGSGVGNQPISVSVTLPPAGKGVQAQAPQGPPVSVVANGRGYGY